MIWAWLDVYRVTVVTDKVVGRFDVAAVGENEANEIARAWAQSEGLRPTEIRLKRKQVDGLPAVVAARTG